MNHYLWSTATAMTLLVSGAASAQNGVAEGSDRYCVEPKPFRKVAQDEIKTISELCMMRDGYVRLDRTLPEKAPQRQIVVNLTGDVAVVYRAHPAYPSR